MSNTQNGLDTAQQLLVKLVEENPDDWAIRKKVVGVLYDSGFYVDSSKMLWSAPEIPPVSEELVFAFGIVSKGQPSRAVRLLDVIVAQNLAEPEETLKIAKLLMAKGMTHQAIRFYGVATAIDPSLTDNEFELSLLSVDLEASHWNKEIKKEGFPWSGPESEDDKGSEKKDEKEEDFADLLSGATMPVPLKATPARKPEASTELRSSADKVKSNEVKSNEVKAADEEKVTIPATVALKENDSSVETKGLRVVPTQELKPEVKNDPVIVAEPEIEEETVTAEDLQDAVKEIEKVKPVFNRQAPDLSVDNSSAVPVANTPTKNKKGMLSSLIGRFRGKGKTEKKSIDVDDLDLSSVESATPNIQGGSSEPDLTKTSPLIKKSIPKPAGTALTKPDDIDSAKLTKTEPKAMSAIASKVERPVENDYSAPDALDGRTQLVALAPEDGGVFFSGLIDKYIALENGPLPETATIAERDAGVDYLGLVNEACRKDLDAFSQLLGLHKIMAEANCDEWIDDMNYLRKGFGDAVLATVVSKYSVAECKEILNHVYSSGSSSKHSA